jgi:hypothetical protein
MGNKNSGQSSIFEIIRDAYVNSDPDIPIDNLGIDQRYREILERWIFIDKQRLKNYPRISTREILNLWKRKYNLSESQFYIDKKNSELLFGQVADINVEYERRLSIEAYDTIISLGFAKGDLKSVIEAQKRKDAITGIDKKVNPDELPEAGSGERKFVLVANFHLDGKAVSHKEIDITNLQDLPLKELKEITRMIDVPEANLDTMAKLIDETTIVENEE